MFNNDPSFDTSASPHRRVGRLMLAAALTLMLVAGCQRDTVEEPEGPDYSRQLPPGASALRLVTDPSRMPDLTEAYRRLRQYDQFFFDGVEQSLSWFGKPSSRQYFPFEGITHEQQIATLHAMRELMRTATDEYEFADTIRSRFDVYESVGYNNEGIVLFTGYYAPIFNASRERTAEFQYPLYSRPDDLVTDPASGEPRGRRTADGSVVPYHTRRQIEESNMFAGNEIVWLRDYLSAYIIQVNGSAKLRMPDGSYMYIGYAGKTDRPYTGLGRMMVDEGHISPNNLSLPAIRAHFRSHPEQVIELIRRNESFVFFAEYDESIWPAGSLGVQVTEEATLATDKRIYPRGGVVLVDTNAVTLSRGQRRFFQFMLDQDTGGAIQAPGRADIFMGIGETAEILAGGQYAEGRLYYFFLKPEFIAEVMERQSASR